LFASCKNISRKERQEKQSAQTQIIILCSLYSLFALCETYFKQRTAEKQSA
jgi:hypothetical protein